MSKKKGKGSRTCYWQKRQVRKGEKRFHVSFFVKAQEKRGFPNPLPTENREKEHTLAVTAVVGRRERGRH